MAVGGCSPVGVGWSAIGVGFSTGASSTSECFPVVHGGMDRNSSKVSTRGLQHFHPVVDVVSAFLVTSVRYRLSRTH